MILRIVIYSVVFGATFFLAWNAGVQYSYAELKSYLDSLVNSSAMVFTIMGIWIAFLYPNALSRLVDPKKVETADFSDSLTETKRLEAIVGSVLKSGIVVLVALSIFMGKILFASSGFYTANHTCVKLSVLALVVTMTYAQAEAVISVLLSNVMFLNDLHRKREERQTAKDI